MREISGFQKAIYFQNKLIALVGLIDEAVKLKENTLELQISLYEYKIFIKVSHTNVKCFHKIDY